MWIICEKESAMYARLLCKKPSSTFGILQSKRANIANYSARVFIYITHISTHLTIQNLHTEHSI